MDTQLPKQTPQEPKHKPHAMFWIAIIVLIVLLALLGYLLWLLFNLNTQVTSLNNDKKQLQSKVDDLTKQITSSKSSSSSPQPIQTCNNTASASLKENIHDAITSKNTAALEGYMASSVTVVIAASEKGSAESAAQAVSDLDYVKGATGPWDFAITSATLATWKAGFYSKYFSGTAYVGKAASGQVISFDFDCNGKINQIFMAASSDLLT